MINFVRSTIVIVINFEADGVIMILPEFLYFIIVEITVKCTHKNLVEMLRFSEFSIFYKLLNSKHVKA